MSEKASRDAELKKSINGGSKLLLHLLEEQWFFCNALGGSRILHIPNKFTVRDELPPPLPPAKPEKEASASALQLVSAPLLPLPQAGCEWIGGIEECGRKLTYSYNYERMQRRRPPRTEIPHRRCTVPHLAVSWEASYKKAFHDKKWRSLGDMATMELQGFKDLGFVSDDMNGLSSRLAGKVKDGGIYLLERGFTRSSTSLMIIQHASRVPGEEMKEQLRLWAKAVACIVWQKF